MQDDLNEEWRRISEHYAQMYDGELMRLASRYSDLTNVAKEVLRVEMLKRGLGDPTKPAEVQQDSGRLRFERGVELDGREERNDDVEGGEMPHEYTWKTDLCECETREQAWQIGTVLGRAKIESWLFDPERDFATRFLGRTPFRVMVAADRLEEARKIIAQPIPQDILDELQTEVPACVIPKCPSCGDPDPTLLEDEQSNRWSCEVCGKEWTELEKLPDEAV
jgi:hypothetical protein